MRQLVNCEVYLESLVNFSKYHETAGQKSKGQYTNVHPRYGRNQTIMHFRTTISFDLQVNTWTFDRWRREADHTLSALFINFESNKFTLSCIFCRTEMTSDRWLKRISLEILLRDPVTGALCRASCSKKKIPGHGFRLCNPLDQSDCRILAKYYLVSRADR